MATIQEYSNKLRSLKNTQKITRTMKMVAASKLRKAQIAQTNAKLYAQNIRHLISRIAVSVTSDSHPLLRPTDTVKKVLILIFTSDKGLCGSFNHNVHKAVSTWVDENQHNYEQIDISCVGKRGFMFFKSRNEIKSHYDGVSISPHFDHAVRIGKDLSKDFINGEYDEVYVTHNEFFSPLSQKTMFEKILPIDPQALMEEGPHPSIDYIFEPEKAEMLEFLIPHYLYFRIYFTLLENAAGEHGARMTAMDSATKNASELIEKTTLLRNRARQSQITTELTEIIAGAEAL